MSAKPDVGLAVFMLALAAYTAWRIVYLNWIGPARRARNAAEAGRPTP